MENILHPYFTWIDFLQTIIMLVVIYFVLHFINRILPKAAIFGKFRKAMQRTTRQMLFLFELIALLVLATTFILIHPVFHGALVLILTIGGFSHIRDYISGQLVRLNPVIAIGKQLNSSHQQGVITNIGRLGLQLKTDQGVQFISYSRLVKKNELSLSGDGVGGFYHLKVTPKQEQEQKREVSLVHFADRLADAPYLDWNHKLEIHTALGQSEGFDATILVKETSHLYDLIKLINEWGYTCEIIQK